MDEALDGLIEVLSRFDPAAPALPPEVARAERERGVSRLVGLAIGGVDRADPEGLLAYARNAILRSDMTIEDVSELVEPLLRQLPDSPRPVGDAALAFAEWLVLDGRLDASLLGTLGADYAVRHHVLGLPRCLRGCDAARLRELATTSSPWVRWAVLDFVADSLRDPRRPAIFEKELLAGWLDDPFAPIARQARHAEEDRHIDELVWALRDRPKDDPEHAAARAHMRRHRRRRPLTFDAFALAFANRAGRSAPYTDDDLEGFLATMAPG